MSASLSLFQPDTESEPKCFIFGTFGPSQTNCFRSFQACLEAAINAKKQIHEDDDLYIFEGTARKIVCILTDHGIEFTMAGKQLPEAA